MTHKWLIDLGVAGGLALALLLVIGLDRILPQVAEEGSVMVITENGPSTAAQPPRMAMTPSTVELGYGAWESMGELLDGLGEGYRYQHIPLEDLLESEKLAKLDILFFTCGKELNDNFRLQQNLREFVAKGGTLYASDWRYDCLKYAFHEYQKPEWAAHGQRGDVTASVRDTGLRDVFGDTVQLHFDLPYWKSAGFGAAGVEALMVGNFTTAVPQGAVAASGPRVTAPLLVRFHHGKGTVIFTSFHNEKGNSDTSRKLLKYLVFSVVTAKENANVTQSLIKGGFSPSKSNLMSASAGDPQVSQTYYHKKQGKLRFVLAFGEGARLRLEVEGPGGVRHEQSGTSTFTIEVPDAAAGDWRYTVTAQQVPYANFPFTLTVAEQSK
jgi:hypothetical protein